MTSVGTAASSTPHRTPIARSRLRTVFIIARLAGEGRRVSKSFHALGLLGRHRGGALCALVDPDRLGVDELADAKDGELAPVAGVLDAAEGDLGSGLAHPVYVDHAGFYLVYEALLLLGVVGPGARAEAEGRVVGEGDGLVYVLDAEERGDGTEDLLLVRRGFVGDVRNDGRRVEVTRPIHRLAAREEASARLDALLDRKRAV